MNGKISNEENLRISQIMQEVKLPTAAELRGIIIKLNSLLE
jgi:hypothetical protein